MLGSFKRLGRDCPTIRKFGPLGLAIGIAFFASIALGACGAEETNFETPDTVPSLAIEVEGVDGTKVNTITQLISDIDGVETVQHDRSYSDAESQMFFVGTTNPLDSNEVASQIELSVELIVDDAEVSAGGSGLLVNDSSNSFRNAQLFIVLLWGVIAIAAMPIGVKPMAALTPIIAFSGLVAGEVGVWLSPEASLSNYRLPAAFAGLAVSSALSLRIAASSNRYKDSSDSLAGNAWQATRLLLADSAAFLIPSLIGVVVTSLYDLVPVRQILAASIVAFLITIIFQPVVMAGLAATLQVTPSRLLQTMVQHVSSRYLILALTFSLFLALYSLFGFPYRSQVDGLVQSNQQSLVFSDSLQRNGGDPTFGLLLKADPDSDTEEFNSWLKKVAAIDQVAWVETNEQRYVNSGTLEQPNVKERAGASLVSDERSALIVTDKRFGQSNIDVAVDLRRIPGPQFSTVSQFVSGPTESQSSKSILWAIGLLALVAVVNVAARTRSLSLSAATFVVRWVMGLAALGVYRLVAPDVAAAEAVSVITIIGLLTLVFDTELVRNAIARTVAGSHQPNLEPGRAGETAAFGMAAIILAGLITAAFASFFGPSTAILRFAAGVAAVGLFELVVGYGLVRPLMLGNHGLYHWLVRPLRNFVGISTYRVASKTIRVENLSEGDQVWHQLVADIVNKRHLSKVNPARFDADSIYLRSTPLRSNAQAELEKLARGQANVAGEAPEIRELRIVSQRFPFSAVVVSDFAETKLVDGTGNVLGVKPAERKSEMIWLVPTRERSYVLAEAIQLAATPLNAAARQGEASVEEASVDDASTDASEVSATVEQVQPKANLTDQIIDLTQTGSDAAIGVVGLDTNGDGDTSAIEDRDVVVEKAGDEDTTVIDLRSDNTSKKKPKKKLKR